MNVTTNQFGAKVNICCASCRFKDATRLMTKRLCTKTNQEVDPYDECEKWLMGDQLKQVGSARGQVKKLDYLQYLVKAREEEEKLKANGEKIEPKSISEIRASYVKGFGSIYEKM